MSGTPLTLTIFPIQKLLELAVWLKSERVDTFALQIYRRPRGSLQHCQLLEVTIRMNWLFQRQRAVKAFIERR